MPPFKMPFLWYTCIIIHTYTWAGLEDLFKGDMLSHILLHVCIKDPVEVHMYTKNA